MRAAVRAIVRTPREEVVLEAVYLTKVRKVRLSKLRGHLKEWGIDTRRVANLSFIGGNILEATVNRAYKREFLETVTRMGWQHVPEFDPLSERTLRRETTQAMSAERRKELAARLYVQRIARSLRATRPGPLKRFLEQMMQRAPNYASHLAAGAGTASAAGQEGTPQEREATPALTPTSTAAPAQAATPPPIPIPTAATTAAATPTSAQPATMDHAATENAAEAVSDEEEAILPQ